MKRRAHAIHLHIIHLFMCDASSLHSLLCSSAAATAQAASAQQIAQCRWLSGLFQQQFKKCALAFTRVSRPQMSPLSFFFSFFLFFAAAVDAAYDCSFNSSYPRSYVALATNFTPVIDGRIDDEFWLETPWTEPFVDISTAASPPLLTRAKIRWDKEWL